MSSGIDIRAPAEQTEGTRSQLLRWLKRVGESVAENEPLIEIETDKVTVEVAAPGSGVLIEVLKHEQDEIAPGELLGRIASGGSAAATHDVATAAAASSGTGAATSATSIAGTTPTASGAPASQLSPAVRRLLAERNLTPEAVRGTGPAGRITVEDVLQAAVGHPGAAPQAAALRSAPEPIPAPDAAAGVRSHRVPHSAIRRRIAEHMVESLLRTAPHVTTVFEADLTAVLRDRARRREEFERRGVPLTLTAYFVQAAVAGIQAVPEANSRWTDAALEIYDDIHIGVATAVEDSGLLVPVLRDAGSRDLFEVARGLEDLVSRARGGKLTPADVRGGTFTISNHGVSGSLVAAPIIINQPQSAILGVGKLEKRPVVVEEGDEQKIVVRPRCYVSLTLDHRVMDGHQANRFMQAFVARLAHWPA